MLVLVRVRVQADLDELGRTPVMVVSAGAKSILDIPLTLEVLESNGVCVLALGTDDFPAFFTRSSGCKAPARVESAAEAAGVAYAQHALGLTSGMLVGVPIPAEAEAEGARVQAAIEQALDEADTAGVAGRHVTPFLLKRINELTDGASLKSNIALVLNNAKVGADIAVELAALSKLRGGSMAVGALAIGLSKHVRHAYIYVIAVFWLLPAILVRVPYKGC